MNARADANRSGVVDGLDLALLLGNWGSCGSGFTGGGEASEPPLLEELVMAEVRPYENGSSEPNSLHVHTYRDPSDPTKLLGDCSWDILDGERWIHRTIAYQEPVASHAFAIERAVKFAHERSIPIVFSEDHSG